jgi:hypothetical protein
MSSGTFLRKRHRHPPADPPREAPVNRPGAFPQTLRDWPAARPGALILDDWPARERASWVIFPVAAQRRGELGGPFVGEEQARRAPSG